MEKTNNYSVSEKYAPQPFGAGEQEREQQRRERCQRLLAGLKVGRRGVVVARPWVLPGSSRGAHRIHLAHVPELVLVTGDPAWVEWSEREAEKILLGESAEDTVLE
jgi:hypothetical protein